jgi:hypothetical protein
VSHHVLEKPFGATIGMNDVWPLVATDLEGSFISVFDFFGGIFSLFFICVNNNH